jgi:hypothetical protein
VCSTASSSVQRLAAALESSVDSQGSLLQGITEQVADFKSRKQQVGGVPSVQDNTSEVCMMAF